MNIIINICLYIYLSLLLYYFLNSNGLNNNEESHIHKILINSNRNITQNNIPNYKTI